VASEAEDLSPDDRELLKGAVKKVCGDQGPEGMRELLAMNDRLVDDPLFPPPAAALIREAIEEWEFDNG
jgi:hypothetical protein